MYSEKVFKETLKKVKDALFMNPQGVQVWNSYVSERNSHVVLVYVGKKPFRTDEVTLWGQFPGKGPLRKVQKGFALLGGELFVEEFLKIKKGDIVSAASKMIGVDINQETDAEGTISDKQAKRAKHGTEPAKPKEKGILRMKSAQNVDTVEEAAEQLIMKAAEDMAMEVIVECMSSFINETETPTSAASLFTPVVFRYGEQFEPSPVQPEKLFFEESPMTPVPYQPHPNQSAVPYPSRFNALSSNFAEHNSLAPPPPFAAQAHFSGQPSFLAAQPHFSGQSFSNHQMVSLLHILNKILWYLLSLLLQHHFLDHHLAWLLNLPWLHLLLFLLLHILNKILWYLLLCCFSTIFWTTTWLCCSIFLGSTSFFHAALQTIDFFKRHKWVKCWNARKGE
jgi:hypothetical protein